MKLNWAERCAVNNPFRVWGQRIEIRQLKAMMSLRPGSTALEVGCGRGAGATLLVREFQLSRLYAMDLDFRMVRMAGRGPAVRKEKGARLFVGDVSCLPLEAGSVDAVFGFGVLHHVVDWRAALREIARVLKPEGAYYIEELYPALYQNFIARKIFFHPPKDRFLSRDLREELKQAGLPLIKTLELKRFALLGVAVKEA